MYHNRKIIWSAATATVLLCIAIGIFLVLPRDGTTPEEPEESPYPTLTPGEKLPDVGADWGLPPGSTVPAFDFDGPFPKMPSKMLVYKTVRPEDVTEAYVRELGEKYFNVPPEAQFSQSGSFLNLIGKTRYFVFTGSTGFIEMGRTHYARTSEDREDYPTDHECKAIAIGYLRERDLLPPDAYVRGTADNVLSSGYVTVAFGRTIGKYKAWGPGSQIIVRVGVGGEVVDVAKQWLELVPYKLAPIITAKEAFERLKRGKAFIGAKGKVTGITLRYHTVGAGPYIQPVYYFEFAHPRYYAVVPAVKPEHLLSPKETSDFYNKLRADPNK